MHRSSTKWRTIVLLGIAEVAVMVLWFSASAVIPALTLEYQLSRFQKALFTSSMQAGFVVGTFACALLVGFAFGGSIFVLAVICLTWGVSVVANSAQFSASVAELSDRSLV